MGAEEGQKTKREIVWEKVLLLVYLHISALYGFLLIFHQAKLLTALFALVLTLISTLSVTLGCHRLWVHRAYEAQWALRLFFAIGQTLTCQGPIYDWVLYHRIHHKYYGTDLDPYNCKLGFIFSQLTCRFITPNPEIEKIKRDIDMKDVEEDDIVMWQKTLYWFVMPIVAVLLPISIAVQYWNESFLASLLIVGFLRIAVSLHYAWLIDSSSILWGLDPLDRKSADTSLVFLVNKSLWPQYHYIIPWDYQSGEYGNYGDGFCNAMLRIFAALGWVYNLKTVTSDGLRNALYMSSSTGKPLLKCLEEQQSVPTFEEVVAEINQTRKLK